MIKYLKNIGLVVMLILSLIQLYDWIQKLREGDLTGSINYGVLSFPKGISNDFHNIYSYLDSDSLQIIGQNALETTNKEESYLARKVAREIGYVLRQKVPSSLSYDYLQLSGYWSVIIQNNTHHALNKVILTLPNTKLVSIRHKGGNSEEIKSNGIIDIGTLQPTEDVYIFAWTDITPSSIYFDDVHLTHEAGLGDITFFVPTGPFGQWFDGPGKFLFKALPFLVLILLLLFIGAWMDSKTEKKDDKGDKNSAPPNHFKKERVK